MSLVNTLAYDVAPLLHYAITHCMLFRFSTHSQYRIVICKNCTCTYTSKVAIGPEHIIPKTNPLALSPICTLSCTLCELKITVHSWARNIRSGSPPNALHSSSYWASVSEPHTCDFNATFPLYVVYIYIYATVTVLLTLRSIFRYFI